MTDSQSKQERELNASTSEIPTGATKEPFEKPRVRFVAPKLVKHGEVSELTGFFGMFSP